MADGENASVWLTGILGEKIPSFSSATWCRKSNRKGKIWRENFNLNLGPESIVVLCQISLLCGSGNGNFYF